MADAIVIIVVIIDFVVFIKAYSNFIIIIIFVVIIVVIIVIIRPEIISLVREINISLIKAPNNNNENDIKNKNNKQ